MDNKIRFVAFNTPIPLDWFKKFISTNFSENGVVAFAIEYNGSVTIEVIDTKNDKQILSIHNMYDIESAVNLIYNLELTL